MYSITSEDTFKELQSVRDRILSVKESEEIPPMVLVGNKCDLEEVRQGAPCARAGAAPAPRAHRRTGSTRVRRAARPPYRNAL